MDNILSNSVNIIAGHLINGVVFETRRVIEDDRGDILHYLRREDALLPEFGEVYMSFVRPGAVKAWKCHRKTAQNLTVPVGAIRVILHDCRTGSPSLGALNEYILSRRNHGVLHIPCNIWYGFEALDERESLIVNCLSQAYDPSESVRLPMDHQSIPYLWGKK